MPWSTSRPDRSPGPAGAGGRPADGPTSRPRTFVTPSGLRLRADVLPGARPSPVLLVHGSGQSRRLWAETAEALAALGWPVVALDLRGHGESDWSPDGDYTLDAYASDLRAVAAALESPPVVVGASLGGLSALLAVGEPPGIAVAGLVLADAAHSFELDGARRIVDVMAADGTGVDGAGDGCRHPQWDPEVLTGVRSLMDPRTAAEGRARLATRALTAPTLLVRGGTSDVVTREIAEEFARLSPVARVTEVRGAGHMVAGDRDGDFTAAVVRFLRSLPGAAPGRGA